MIERSIIHVGGSPGSGKSRMARSLVDRLHTSTDLRAEHISIGDQVRLLGRGAIDSALQEYVNLHLANPHTANEPLEDGAILEVLINSIDTAARRDTNIIFLDGYPRYPEQVGTYFHYSGLYGYDAPGALIASVDKETALLRMLKRGRDHQERSMSLMQAWNKLEDHEMTYPIVIHELGSYSMRFDVHTIDTSGQKQYTDREAFRAAMQLIDESLPRSA